MMFRMADGPRVTDSERNRARMSVRPGIIGLWQVSGRSSITSFKDVVKFDRTYIETWSPLLDVKIMLKTIVVVLRGDGAE